MTMLRSGGGPSGRRPLDTRRLLLIVAIAATASPVAATHGPDSAPDVVITAVFPDGFLPGDADEAVQLWNVGPAAADLSGWSIGDGSRRAGFPEGAGIEPGQRWWLARDGQAFRTVFGHEADWAWGAPGGARPLATVGGGPRLANGGDAIELRDSRGALVDAVLYGSGATPPASGWLGPAVKAYRTPAIWAANQVLHRKLDPRTGLPVPDTDRAADWASDPDDPVLGRRSRRPGWDLEERLRPVRTTATGTWEVAVAPDALHAFLHRRLGDARASIDLMAYTLEHADLAAVLAERARAGVRVRILVDGAPAGGISHDERWCLHHVALAGGEVHWMDDGGDVPARYRSAHAKVAVVDATWALVGSENPGPGSAPAHPPADGTSGRRGIWLATDAPPVVEWAMEVIDRDLDPGHHVDVRPFQPRDPARGAPAEDYVPDPGGGGTGYEPLFARTLTVTGTHAVALVSAPENALEPDHGPLGLLDRAGPGDEVLVEQLREPLWWGAGPSEGRRAANPRPEAYIEAARRGARVRVLLDAYFDEPGHWNANFATVRHLEAVAAAEGLDLAARYGNPTGKGIHNKMVLVRAASGRRADGSACAAWAHIGSLNGSETAHKVNRELALHVCSDDIHAYLSSVFAYDWDNSPSGPLWLPWVGRRPQEPAVSAAERAPAWHRHPRMAIVSVHRAAHAGGAGGHPIDAWRNT